MGLLLKSLNIEFTRELTSKNCRWIRNYKKYDFYIKNCETIVETHGIQHYEEANRGGRTLKQEQENDEFKKEMALVNGIKEENYIVIDCRESNIDFIRKSILNSRLANIFDLTNIDWIEVDRLSQKSLVKEVYDYHRNTKETYTSIGKVFKLSRHTVSRYVKKGIELNL